MARIRVFLCTYRRPQLLRRALGSLLAQTCTDWICELHNDAPDDDAPRGVLEELAHGDPRFSYLAHERNWGAVAMFNHVYAGGAEEFATLLEDDNWWEPEFLATALRELDARPAAALAWANMRIWREGADGSWRDTARTIWPVETSARGPREFRWPELLQAFDALHSQGAMLFRPARFAPPAVPPSTPLALIEPLRERAARGPLVFLPQPLAHFAHTRSTARSSDAVQWAQARVLLAASFFGRVAVNPADLTRMWAARRSLRPRDTSVLFFAAALLAMPRLLRGASAADWAHVLLGVARHPVRGWQTLRARRAQPAVWQWLLSSSAASERPASATMLDKSQETPRPPEKRAAASPGAGLSR